MPRKDSILNLPGFAITKLTGTSPLVLDVHYRRAVRCVYCDGRQLRKKACFIRRVRHESIGLRQTWLRFKAYKFYCRACQRYFNQRFPGILKHQRSSEKLRQQVFQQHTQGVSQKDLANHVGVGKATIERWYHQQYQRANGELINKPCPQLLGIDEHFFSRKLGFATTLCDLRHHKIFDVVPGRSQSSLADYLNQLPGKEKVKVVCMDLSSTYRQIVQRYFPNAMIVADRFHVIRLINQLCLQTYQHIDQTNKYQRGILALLRRKPETMTLLQHQKRQDYLQQQPAIAAIDAFKQRLHQLLMYKHRKARQCKRLLPIFIKMIEQLKHSPFKPLNTLGKTLYRWREAIVRMWRFTKNNGITEGFHRKMKLIQRRAYGFRNFENYRLRVRVLCS